VTTESSVDANLGPAARSGSLAIEQTRSLRLPAALTLLLVNLFWLLISVERFLIPREKVDPPPGFGERARASFDDFAGLAPILLPLVAVLLVTHIAPVVAEAKLLLVAALSEYALSASFAVIAFVAGFFAPGHSGRSIVEDGFTGLGSLILLGMASFVAFRVAQVLFRGEPKPDRFAAYGRVDAAEPVSAPPPNTAPLPPHYAAPPRKDYGFQPHGGPSRPPSPETPGE
jgi:hypothetical protein